MRRVLVSGLPFLALLGLVMTAASTPAQIRVGQFGFTVDGQLGTAGEFCWNFDCEPRPGRALLGEVLDLTVRAPLSAPYAIGLSLGAGGCREIPGVVNELVLEFPLLVLAPGLVGQPSQIRACYGGFEVRRLRVPAFLPPGFQFALQAAAVIPTEHGIGPAVSAAVLITVE